jgi:glucose/arabinose dehydrogenase
MKLLSVSVLARRTSFFGAVCAGALLLIASNAQAQNLFVAEAEAGNIYEFTQGGVQSTFASGLDAPYGLAFDSAGDLFEMDAGSDTIQEIRPGGALSTFASGFLNPQGLAFQGVTLPVPEPSALGLLAAGATALLVRRHCKLAALINY